MASSNIITAGAPVQAPPIVQQLNSVFAALDDEPLISVLTGPSRRGPKGHAIATLWRCFVAKYVMGLASTDALIRELYNNPLIAETCGISSPTTVPHKSTFSRFFNRLSKRDYLAKVKDVSRSLVKKHYETLPGFGERVAIDSSTLKGWVNGGKPKPSDPEAGWSVKKNTHGKTEFVLGYKLHLLVDCEYELPISANVSPGNVNDYKRASNVLSEARWGRSRFKPRYILADSGYSGKSLFRLIKRQYRSNPIIMINKSHKSLMSEWGETQRSPEWKALFAQRPAVERAFSRLKGQRSLNKITVRRLRKVTLHCYLSLVAMQGSYLPTHDKL